MTAKPDNPPAVRQIDHYLANLKYRQTTTYGPVLEGFAYAEVPHWQLLQWRDATLAERTKTDDR